MDKNEIKAFIESKNAEGCTIFPTAKMKRWLRENRLIVEVALGTGKVTFKRC